MATRFEPFIEKVARFRKERKLRSEPGMDEFAVRLNRQPTWDEKRFVEQFIDDLEACGFTLTVPGKP